MESGALKTCPVTGHTVGDASARMGTLKGIVKEETGRGRPSTQKRASWLGFDSWNPEK